LVLSLFDFVSCEFLPELGQGHFVLGLVERGDGGLEGGTVHEVLLPGHFVAGVGLGFTAPGPKPTQGMP